MAREMQVNPFAGGRPGLFNEDESGVGTDEGRNGRSNAGTEPVGASCRCGSEPGSPTRRWYWDKQEATVEGVLYGVDSRVPRSRSNLMARKCPQATERVENIEVRQSSGRFVRALVHVLCGGVQQRANGQPGLKTPGAEGLMSMKPGDPTED